MKIRVTPQPRPADVNERLASLITGIANAANVAQMQQAARDAQRRGKP